MSGNASVSLVIGSSGAARQRWHRSILLFLFGLNTLAHSVNADVFSTQPSSFKGNLRLSLIVGGFFSSHSQKYSFRTWRVGLRRLCPSRSFFSLLFGGITSCLHNSFILQDKTAISLISQAAFQPWISRWNNVYGQRCCLCWSLTFPAGCTSLHTLEFTQFHWACDLYTQPVIHITPSKSLNLWVFNFKSQSPVQLNSFKSTLLIWNICYKETKSNEIAILPKVVVWVGQSQTINGTETCSRLCRWWNPFSFVPTSLHCHLALSWKSAEIKKTKKPYQHFQTKLCMKWKLN